MWWDTGLRDRFWVNMHQLHFLHWQIPLQNASPKQRLAHLCWICDLKGTFKQNSIDASRLIAWMENANWNPLGMKLANCETYKSFCVSGDAYEVCSDGTPAGSRAGRQKTAMVTTQYFSDSKLVPLLATEFDCPCKSPNKVQFKTWHFACVLTPTHERLADIYWLATNNINEAHAIHGSECGRDQPGFGCKTEEHMIS